MPLTTSFSRWKILLQSSSISYLYLKMDAGNGTFEEEFRGYAFQELYGEHWVALLNVCIFALILGTLLEWNVLWHLRVRLSKYQGRKYQMLQSPLYNERT